MLIYPRNARPKHRGHFDTTHIIIPIGRKTKTQMKHLLKHTILKGIETIMDTK